MIYKETLRIGTKSPFLPFAQLGIACLVLAACAFWPRTGAAALLVPVSGDNRAAANWAHQHGLLLMGAGRMSGSLVVKTGQQIPFWAALRSGHLLLAAPALSCAPTNTNHRPPLG